VKPLRPGAQGRAAEPGSAGLCRWGACMHLRVDLRMHLRVPSVCALVCARVLG